MAKINFLPWRELRREHLKRQFIIMLASTLAAGAAVIWQADYYINAEMEDQTARNNYLRQEISVLDRNIQEIADLKKRRQQLLERIKIITALQGNRSVVAHVLDQLVRNLPEGVYFNEVRLVGDNLLLQGSSESNGRIANLMRNLDASDWLQSPSLTEVKAATAKEVGQRSQFRLSVQQVIPKATPAGATQP